MLREKIIISFQLSSEVVSALGYVQETSHHLSVYLAWNTIRKEGVPSIRCPTHCWYPSSFCKYLHGWDEGTRCTSCCKNNTEAHGGLVRKSCVTEKCALFPFLHFSAVILLSCFKYFTIINEELPQWKAHINLTWKRNYENYETIKTHCSS